MTSVIAIKMNKFMKKIKAVSVKLNNQQKNSISDARTPQPVEIVFNTMRYRRSETVQRSGYFQSSVSYINSQ